jgi:hypothetical protein
MRIGFAMRQQSIAAVYSKALRLNSSSIAYVSPGKVMRLSCFHPSLGCLKPQASLYEQASDSFALECWDVSAWPSLFQLLLLFQRGRSESFW